MNITDIIKELSFYSKDKCWFLPDIEVKCETSEDGKKEINISDDCGLFTGYSNQIPQPYGNTLHTKHQQYDNFDIYYKNKCVNKLTYNQILMLIRNEKIKNIINEIG